MVLGEIQAQATGAETWLKKVRNDLYTAAAITQRTRAVDTRRDRADMVPVPVQVILATQPDYLHAVNGAALHGVAHQHGPGG